MLADDLSTDLVHYMPHLRDMQRRGMTLPNFIDSLSLCCPSRASIVTGNYPHNTDVFSNIAPTGGFRVFHRRGEERRTFATSLSRVGYRTALVGKYLNGYPPLGTVDGQSPYIPPGWSEWDVAGYGYNQYDYDLTQNRTVQHFGNAPQDYLTTVLDERARAFISSSAAANQPFLLEVAPFTPHDPWVSAPRDVGTFPGIHAPRTADFARKPTNPPRWLSEHRPLTRSQIQDLDRTFQLRVEAVQSVDRMLADIYRELRRTNEADRTYVLFTSDNGYHLGDHGLTAGKLTAFDTDIRVPLVVTGPDVPAGSRNRALVQNVDLAPTFDALGNARVPPSTDGQSMVRLLRGDTPRRWPNLALVEQHGPLNARDDVPRLDPDFPKAGSGNPPSYAAIRSAGFIYVKYANGEREYYNLRTDPAELHNIAASLSPRRRRHLDRELSALENCSGATQCHHARYSTTP